MIQFYIEKAAELASRAAFLRFGVLLTLISLKHVRIAIHLSDATEDNSFQYSI